MLLLVTRVAASATWVLFQPVKLKLTLWLMLYISENLLHNSLSEIKSREAFNASQVCLLNAFNRISRGIIVNVGMGED
jgi:hypothetical protein